VAGVDVIQFLADMVRIPSVSLFADDSISTCG
jgi:hypothetical protein